MSNHAMRSNRGFTLVELMIVLVVAAILVAIAVPSYSQYVERARRNDAQAALLENVNFLERNFSNSGRYDQDAAANSITDADLPAGETPQGESGTDRYYDINLVATQNTFTLTADSINSQSDDPCGDLTLNQAGMEGVSNASKPADECW